MAKRRPEHANVTKSTIRVQRLDVPKALCDEHGLGHLEYPLFLNGRKIGSGTLYTERGRHALSGLTPLLRATGAKVGDSFRIEVKTLGHGSKELHFTFEPAGNALPVAPAVEAELPEQPQEQPPGPGAEPQDPAEGGQGYETDAQTRRAIEERAMDLAVSHYREQGHAVEIKAATEAFDLRCLKQAVELRVEVKGTRGDGSAVELTIGEVLNARGTDWSTDLFIVRHIHVDREADGPVARGGEVRILEGWTPDDQLLTAIRFRYAVPPE